MGVGERMGCEGGQGGWWWFGEGRGTKVGGWEMGVRVGVGWGSSPDDEDELRKGVTERDPG